jgi:TatD DNase family protein
LDVNKLVLETDAPYLAPDPKRGRRNESANLVYVAQKLSEIYQLPFKEIAEITTSNARKLFGI